MPSREQKVILTRGDYSGASEQERRPSEPGERASCSAVAQQSHYPRIHTANAVLSLVSPLKSSRKFSQGQFCCWWGRVNEHLESSFCLRLSSKFVLSSVECRLCPTVKNARASGEFIAAGACFYLDLNREEYSRTPLLAAHTQYRY